MNKTAAIALSLALVPATIITTFADTFSGLDLAIVQNPTTLFTEANTSSTPFLKAPVGKKLILVSRSLVGGWANVIDYSTGRQGWVLSQRVRLKFAAHKDQAVNLPGQSDGPSDTNSVVTISNRMGIPLFLHVEGLLEVVIIPGLDKSVQVPPGIHAFNVAGPLVRPKFGSKAFINGERYTWKWWVGNGHQPDTVASKESALQFKSLQNEIKALEDELKNSRAVLDTLKLNTEREHTSLSLERSNVEAKRTSLNNASQSDIDAFNGLVDKANADKTALLADLDSYDKSVNDYNQKLKTLKAKHDLLNRVADSVNGK